MQEQFLKNGEKILRNKNIRETKSDPFDEKNQKTP